MAFNAFLNFWFRCSPAHNNMTNGQKMCECVLSGRGSAVICRLLTAARRDTARPLSNNKHPEAHGDFLHHNSKLISHNYEKTEIKTLLYSGVEASIVPAQKPRALTSRHNLISQSHVLAVNKCTCGVTVSFAVTSNTHLIT